jgi:hypothetical protein
MEQFLVKIISCLKRNKTEWLVSQATSHVLVVYDFLYISFFTPSLAFALGAEVNLS